MPTIAYLPDTSMTLAPTLSPSSNTTATPNATVRFWLGLTAAVSIVAGALLLLSFRRRRSFGRRSISGVEVINEALLDETDSGDMGSVDGSDVQSSGSIWMTPVPSSATVPHDAQNLDDPDSIWMMPVPSSATVPLDAQNSDGTPVSSTVTVPRYARDLDGISPSSLKLLLRESAAPAFMGEGLSLFPKPTRTNIHPHPRHSELEPRRGHVEQGPHRSNERSRRRSRIAAHLCPTLHRQGRIGPGVLGQSVRAKELMVDHQALIIEDCLCLPSVKVGNVRMI